MRWRWLLLILAGLLLGGGATAALEWPFFYRLGGRQTAPGLERIAGVKRVPDGFIVPGHMTWRWYRFVFGDSSTDASVEAMFRQEHVIGMQAIEYLPDGTVFEIMRDRGLKGMFSQDPKEIMERTQLMQDPEDEDEQGRFNFDPNNKRFTVRSRGVMQIGGRPAAWALVDLVQTDNSRATAFVADCTAPELNELIIIHGVTKGPAFNMAAAQRLFSVMKL